MVLSFWRGLNLQQIDDDNAMIEEDERMINEAGENESSGTVSRSKLERLMWNPRQRFCWSRPVCCG